MPGLQVVGAAELRAATPPVPINAGTPPVPINALAGPPPPVSINSLAADQRRREVIAARIELEERQLQQRQALAEARRKYEEMYPPIIEVWAGTCANYTITQTIGTGAATMNNTWPLWNIQYTSTSAVTYNNFPFNTITSSTNTINHFAWNAWVDRYERIKEAGDHAANIQRYSRRKLSDTELLAALEQEKRAREEAEKRALAAKMAEKRADDLLRLCLSPQQIEDFEKKNCFYIEVTSSDGRKKERYRIDRGSHGNVKQVDEKGSIIRSFCIQPSGVPIGDVLLTQKLWLEASEATREKFWETANITTLMQEKNIPHTVPRHERRRYAEIHGLLH